MFKNQDNIYFNPGCALTIYKPEKVREIIAYLGEHIPQIQLHELCCRHDPQLSEGSVIINVCAGCDRRFRTFYEGISTISLWEVMDELGEFPFPDYEGLEMSIHDACPVRDNPAVHNAIRSLLHKMNIQIKEAVAHGEKSICCGDSLYPSCDMERIHKAMKSRANSMPCENVAVYCVGCVQAMAIGGRTPRHMVDLLFGEETIPQKCSVAAWHNQLDRYILEH